MNHSIQFHGLDYVLAPGSYHQGYLVTKKQDWQWSFQLITKENILADVYGKVEISKVLPMVIQAFDLEANEAYDVLSSIQKDLSDVNAEDPFVDLVTRVYRFLLQENLIKKNPFGHLKYQGKKILVDGYLVEDPLLNDLFHMLKMEVQYVKPPSIGQHIVHHFDAMEDEVTYVFNKIAHLLKQGTPIQDIIMIEPHERYLYELQRQSDYFKIPIRISGQEMMFSLPIAQWYLQEIEQGKNPIAVLASPMPFDEKDVNLLRKTLQDAGLNQGLSFRQQLDLCRYTLQKTKLHAPRYAHAIQVTKDWYPLKHQHVFILGFAQGRYPTIQRDVSQLPVSIQQTLGWLTTAQQNALSLNRIMLLLGRSQRLNISFSKIEQGQTMVVSPLVTMFHFQTKSGDIVPDNIDYSQNLGLVRREKYRFLKQRFRFEHPLLFVYESHFQDKIQAFDYGFHAYDAGLKDKKMTLSYSAIKDYYQCGFKYYVGRVLKVKPLDQDEFHMHLGTFAHAVFEEVGERLDLFPKIFHEVLNQQIGLTPKEVVLFSHLYDQLYQVCQFNVLHQTQMAFSQRFVEEKMDVALDTKTNMIGYIDKIIELKDEFGNPYVAVVDYKSGSESFNEALLPYGWSLQLPIYAWMLKQHPKFKDHNILGVFIQHIIEKSFSPKKELIQGQAFPKTYQLDGIILNDPKRFQYLDRSIQQGKSNFIAGVSLTKQGAFNQTSKRLKSGADFQRFITVAEQQIHQANQAIRHHDFPINPKQIKGKTSCQHCPFIDTCFRQHKDINVIATTNDDEEDSADADVN
jgi:hypothetical protein